MAEFYCIEQLELIRPYFDQFFFSLIPMKDSKLFQSFFNHLLPVLDADESKIRRLESIMLSADPVSDQAFVETCKDGLDLLRGAHRIRKFAAAELARTTGTAI